MTETDAISHHAKHKHFILLCRACRRVLATCGCTHAPKPRRYSLEVCDHCVSGGCGDGVPAGGAPQPAVRNGKSHSTVLQS
jgi:hypothetical protein